MKKRLYMVQVNNRYGENVYLPYSVGLLWAYARTFPEIVEAYDMCGFLYEKEPIERAVAKLENPDLVAISCYIWNWEWSRAFARAVKEKWPDCTIIVGGVQVQDASTEILDENPQFDFAIYGEGEGAFAKFLRFHLLVESGVVVGYWEIESLIWRRKPNDEVVANPRAAFVPLEDLRSPYLDGVFDELLPREKRWQVLQETTRGCPYASFAGDTYVALPDRILRFDEQEYNGNTLACPDSSHRHRLGVDGRLVSQGLRECIKFTFSNGLTLAVTSEHPMFKVHDEKIVDVKASELRLLDWVPVEVGQNVIDSPVALESPSKTAAEQSSEAGFGQGRRVPEAVHLPTHLTEDVAWLTGYLIGDGCLPADDRASVLFAVTTDLRANLESAVRSCFHAKLHVTKARNTNKMQHGAIHSRKVVQFFRESLGIESGEAKLKVPRALFRSPSSVVRAFLNGLWSADGYWPKQSEPYLTTVSEQLAQECAMLIHWLGDAAIVRKVKYRGFGKQRPFTYRVEWHGDECRRRMKGKPCVLSRVPIVRHTYRDRSGMLRLRHIANHVFREGTPREVLRHFAPDHPLLDSRFIYVQVTAIESAGICETFDVHHHPEHKVAANGAFVRQCTFCAWGQAAQSDLRQFPMERVAAELEWFGQRQVDYLDNADANFGITKRDVEIAKLTAVTKRAYGAPRTFRTSFAKNSNEVVWEIANILHDAGMLKSVTLAMQSMDDGVLVNIKRKNIKHDKFELLIQRYEAAGIPTYTELILGLPGESLDKFIDGIEQNLVAGQHSGLFVYINLMLNNTEQRDPKYVEAHGIKTLPLKAMLSHATPDPSAIREVQPVVVETSAMSHERWKMGWLYSKVVEVFHAQGLLQNIAVRLHERGWSYFDFYDRLMTWIVLHPESCAAREVINIALVLERALAGGLWDCVDERLGDVSWPPEEFAFARLCLEMDRFYDEVEPFLRRMGATDEEIDAQRRALKRPEGDTAAWAREMVWYGRRGKGAMKRRAQ